MEIPTKDNLDKEFEIFDTKQDRLVKTTWRTELENEVLTIWEDGYFRHYFKKLITGIKFP